MTLGKAVVLLIAGIFAACLVWAFGGNAKAQGVQCFPIEESLTALRESGWTILTPIQLANVASDYILVMIAPDSNMASAFPVDDGCLLLAFEMPLGPYTAPAVEKGVGL